MTKTKILIAVFAILRGLRQVPALCQNVGISFIIHAFKKDYKFDGILQEFYLVFVIALCVNNGLNYQSIAPSKSRFVKISN